MSIDDEVPPNSFSNRWCTSCVNWYHHSNMCATCRKCWHCCTHMERYQLWAKRFGVYIARCIVPDELILIGVTSMMYTSTMEEEKALKDYSIKLKDPLGAECLITDKDLELTHTELMEHIKEVVASYVDYGYTIPVYSGGSRNRGDGAAKDFTLDTTGKKILCKNDACDGYLHLRQFTAKNGKQYRSVECEHYNFQGTDKEKEAHTNVSLFEFKDETAPEFVSVPTREKKKDGSVKKATVPVPDKFGVTQAKFLASDGEDDGDEVVADTDKEPF